MELAGPYESAPFLGMHRNRRAKFVHRILKTQKLIKNGKNRDLGFSFLCINLLKVIL
jgi:hypothetical protein